MDPFNYVPTDMFSGFPIPDVFFQCSTRAYPLTFSINAFTSAESGLCTLTGRLVIDRCNMRQINGDMFIGCNKLETLVFTTSIIEEFIRVPKLDNLKNLTINPRVRDISNAMTTLEISELPQLTYLDLAYNSLSDKDVAFISNCSNLQEVYLLPSTEISYSQVPDLTNLPFLRIFQIPLGQKNLNVSLLLPNPRRSNANLSVTIESTPNTPNYYINELKGDFYSVFLNLSLPMEYLNESVFYEPLDSLVDGFIVLSTSPTLRCKCDLSWLIRDHPRLLSRIQNGTCADGRPLQSLPTDELVCCPVDSLVARNEQLVMLNHQLVAEIEELKLLSQKHD